MEWLELYRRAWEQGDSDSVVDLFTTDATYHSAPFRDPHVGHEGIHAYWESATGTQSDTEVRIGTPIVDGARVAAEWWATFVDTDEGPVTLPGILLLNFSRDGLCTMLREHWCFAPAVVEPHEGWGRLNPGSKNVSGGFALSWAEGYRDAWANLDAEAAAALYSQDCSFRSQSFRDPHIGREQVRVYTETAFSSEVDPYPRFGTAFVTDGAAAVEYWTTMADAASGKPQTLAGCSLMMFDAGGSVSQSRDYWNVQEGSFEPYPGWGS